MFFLKLAIATAFGAALGYGAHVVWTPAFEGTCAVICHPVRAPVAGALIGAATACVHRIIAGRADDCPAARDYP